MAGAPIGHRLRPPADAALRPPEIADALACLEKASLPLAEVHEHRNVRAALNSLTLLLNGKPAAAKKVARKRTNLYNAFE